MGQKGNGYQIWAPWANTTLASQETEGEKES